MAWVLACATFPLLWVGGLITTTDAGMAVPDWPGTYGYNMFLYPWQTWLFGPWDLFIEHGRSRNEKTMRWQDRLNPTWSWLSDGCNLNRPIDEIVTRGGFELASLNEFLGRGPAVVSSLYRGAAIKP